MQSNWKKNDEKWCAIKIENKTLALCLHLKIDKKSIEAAVLFFLFDKKIQHNNYDHSVH